MRRKQIVLAVGIGLFALVLIQAAPGNGMSHHWSQVFDGAFGSRQSSVAIDWAGNAIVTGRFSGTVDFGGGVLTSAGLNDIFVAKISPSGDHVWSQRFGSAGQQYAWDVAVDASGNIVVTGIMEGPVDFGGGPLAGSGIFVARFDPQGTHLWSQVFGADDVWWPLVAADPSGNVLLTGRFRGTINLGGGALTSADISRDIFVAKFSPSGAHIWSQRQGDVGADDCYGIAADASGNVLLSGNAAVDFGGGTLPFYPFLAKLAPDGSHIWSQSFERAVAYSLAVDHASNILISGVHGANDFGGGVLPGVLFLARFNPSGAHVWSRGFIVTGSYYEAFVTADADGNAFITGPFSDGATFGGGDFWTLWEWEADMYVAKYDTAGAHLWSQAFQQTDQGDSDQVGESIAADAFGNVIVTGQAGRNVDFGGGGLGTAGEVFLVKFGPTGTSVSGIPSNSGLDVSAYPNPFNPGTTIRYSIPQRGLVRLAVYDVRGRWVRTLVNTVEVAGDHTVAWNGRDSRGAHAASGVYFVRLESGGHSQTRKITLIE